MLKTEQKMTEVKRKGARSIKEIPSDILEQLNKGEIETANLVEWLAIDGKTLLESVLTQCNKTKYFKHIWAKVEKLEKLTGNTINDAIGTGLFEQAKINNDNDLVLAVSTHTSDLVRCWATCIVGKDTELSIEEMLEKIKPFATDRHFNVRECAWSVVRKSIIANFDKSLDILSKWVKDEDENIRRFASEATRPRGVWCDHITVLKQNPEIGLCIIEPLKSDESRYVQNSVANWLNDASKTQPEFVTNLCNRWEKESGSKETKYIIKRALRTINKKLVP